MWHEEKASGREAQYRMEDGTEAFASAGVGAIASGVRTLYKRKGMKVRSVDKRSVNGVVPGGEQNWVKK